jgi:hypothetical protein
MPVGDGANRTRIPGLDTTRTLPRDRSRPTDRSIDISSGRWPDEVRCSPPSAPQELRQIRVLVPKEDGQTVPSVAGILTFGVFPQQFFPQLTISVVVFPNVANVGTDAPRFEDNPVSGARFRILSQRPFRCYGDT